MTTKLMWRAPKDGSKRCSGCGTDIAVDEGHWHDGRCYCDGCEDAPADAADPDSRVYDRPDTEEVR